VLRHYTLQPHLAGVAEDQLAIVGEVLVQTQSRRAPTQQARERRLARLQRLGPQVLAARIGLPLPQPARLRALAEAGSGPVRWRHPLGTFRSYQT
jgi:hypothetical protein